MTGWLATAAGLVLVIEGLFYAVVPGHLKKLLRTMQELSEDQLRAGDVFAMALGVVVVWLARGLGG